MITTTVFDQIVDLKKKFQDAFVHKKQLKALQNYSYAASELIQNLEDANAPMPFTKVKKLNLIKAAIDEGFLDEDDAWYLSRMLDKFKLNFLDWCHKTKWLDQEMERIKSLRVIPEIEKLSLFPNIILPKQQVKYCPRMYKPEFIQRMRA